jgi:putative hydrolase of the HAD superfamily
MTARPYDVLLLDFGGVCLLNPAELHAVVEDHFGLPRGTFTWMGPLDPATDDLYRESIRAGGMSERDYWTRRAADVGRTAGVEVDLVAYMNVAYGSPGNQLIRPEAIDVADAARAAGLGVSVLTNDLHAFHDDAWVAQIDVLTKVDHLVDCSHVGFLKPDRRAYEWALDELGDVDPERVLFVDDQPLNAEGAAVVGMHSEWFDISEATTSWRRVAKRIGV